MVSVCIVFKRPHESKGSAKVRHVPSVAVEAPITLKYNGTRQHTSHDETCKNNFLDCRIRVNGRKQNKRDGKRGQHTVSTVYTPKFIRQNISVFKFFHLGQRFGFLPFWCTTFTFCSAYRVNEPWIRKDFVAFSPPALSCKRSLREQVSGLESTASRVLVPDMYDRQGVVK